MLEIKPLLPAYPVVKPGKIKKDDPPSGQRQRKNKPLLEEQEMQPAQHIDEVV
jgi:hypothetical protein